LESRHDHFYLEFLARSYLFAGVKGVVVILLWTGRRDGWWRLKEQEQSGNE
jgi:hypothetical protein